jgi:hypothetical protein
LPATAVARGAPSITMDIDDQPGASSPLERASSPASATHARPVKKQAPRTRSRRGPAGASGRQQHPQSQLLARRRPAQQQLRHPQGSARGASEQHPRNQLIGAWRRGAPQGGKDVHEDRRWAAANPTPSPALWTWDLGRAKPVRRPSIATTAQCCDQFPSGLCLGEAHHRSWRARRARHHG